MIDCTAVTKVKKNDEPSDFAFWQQQPYEERLRTLEMIRQEYHAYDDGAQPRLQRVYRIVERT